MAEGNCVYPLNILILGDNEVGKTSIINRYVYDTYDGYSLPHGVDGNFCIVKLFLW